jgi:hypothetical protein
MPQSREVRDRPATEAADRRVEVDLVRFESTRLPSGLFRHTAAKFVFQLSKRDAREGWTRE